MSNCLRISLLGACLVMALAAVRAVPEGRILNGVPALPGQFPHQISLRKFRKHICGGSIISTKFVLTAAHCVGVYQNKKFNVFDPKIYSVYAGTINRSRNGFEYPVAALIPHKDFRNLLNDIALVKLALPLKYSKLIQPIALMPPATTSQALLVAGWGRNATDGPLPATLQWTIIRSMPDDSCKRKVGGAERSLICLSPLKNHGTCTFDSGSPAIDEGNALVGVDSFRYGSCEDKKPRIFTKVFYYIDWIRKNSDL